MKTGLLAPSIFEGCLEPFGHFNESDGVDTYFRKRNKVTIKVTIFTEAVSYRILQCFLTFLIYYNTFFVNCRTPGHRPQDPVEAQFFQYVSSGLLIFEAGKAAPRGPSSGLQDGPHIGFCPGKPSTAVSYCSLQCFLLADVVSYRILQCVRYLRPTFWGHLGSILGPLGAILGPSWGHLGAILGPFWGHLGVIYNTARVLPLVMIAALTWP